MPNSAPSTLASSSKPREPDGSRSSSLAIIPATLSGTLGSSASTGCPSTSPPASTESTRRTDSSGKPSLRRSIIEQRAERLVAALQLRWAIHADQQQRPRADARAEPAQHVDARRIRPVLVFQHQQERTARRGGAQRLHQLEPGQDPLDLAGTEPLYGDTIIGRRVSVP